MVAGGHEEAYNNQSFVCVKLQNVEFTVEGLQKPVAEASRWLNDLTLDAPEAKLRFRIFPSSSFWFEVSKFRPSTIDASTALDSGVPTRRGHTLVSPLNLFLGCIESTRRYRRACSRLVWAKSLTPRLAT
ncbi:hypothetical protein TWF103_002892 [Orbilia oligospora]|nr:hypothetical protein TWF103_002892 [Orbilia oligospora]